MNEKYNEHDINTCKIGNCLISIGKIGIVVSAALYLASIIIYADVLSINTIPLLVIGTPLVSLPWLIVVGLGTYLNFTYDKIITLRELNSSIKTATIELGKKLDVQTTIITGVVKLMNKK